MRIHRAYAPELGAPELELEGDEAQHLGRVLRVRPGDEVELFDGEGQALRYRVARVERRRVALELVGPGDPDLALRLPITLAVAPPKGKRAQRLVEGLTELGVVDVRFLELERTQARSPEPAQALRWTQEAAKQCGRNRLPRIEVGWDLARLLEAVRDAPRCWVGDPRGARPVRDALAEPAPEALLLVVGPEGGLSDAELEALVEAGAQPVRLGASVLRVETAALALVAAAVGGWEGAS